jgi:hypothetical protein
MDKSEVTHAPFLVDASSSPIIVDASSKEER